MHVQWTVTDSMVSYDYYQASRHQRIRSIAAINRRLKSHHFSLPLPRYKSKTMEPAIIYIRYRYTW